MQIGHIYECGLQPIFGKDSLIEPLVFGISKWSKNSSDSIELSFELRSSCGSQSASSVTTFDHEVDIDFKYEVTIICIAGNRFILWCSWNITFRFLFIYLVILVYRFQFLQKILQILINSCNSTTQISSSGTHSWSPTLDPVPNSSCSSLQHICPKPTFSVSWTLIQVSSLVQISISKCQGGRVTSGKCLYWPHGGSGPWRPLPGTFFKCTKFPGIWIWLV